MGSYIANFTVYTMAMLGLIFFALFVYKKFMNGGFSSHNSSFLDIEETMNINPRKSLIVVRAGDEKFLIASDVDRTTLLSKLGNSDVNNIETFNNAIQNIKPENKQKISNIKSTQNRIIDMNVVQDKKPVHLEPIKEKNSESSQLRRGMDSRETYRPKAKPIQNQQKNVTLDFETPVNHGLSTMKEMAKKINEL